MFIINFLLEHVSGIIMPIFRRTKTVLLHMVYCSGSAGCDWQRLWGAALQDASTARILQRSAEVDNKHLIVSSCWFYLSSHFAHDARSQEPKVSRNNFDFSMRTMSRTLTPMQWVKTKQDRHCAYKCNIEVHSSNHCCRGKAINVTYFEFVSEPWVSSAQRTCPVVYFHI